MAAPDPATIAAIVNAIVAVGGPLLSNLFGDSKQVSNLTGGQEGFQDQIIQALQGGGGPLSFLDPNNALTDFDRLVGDPARQRFQQLTIPQIQQKFAGVGALRGTSAGDTIARSGADLETGLSKQAFQAQQSALDRALNAANPALRSRFGTQRDENPIGAFFSGVGQGSGEAFNIQDLLEGFLGPSEIQDRRRKNSQTASQVG